MFLCKCSVHARVTQDSGTCSPDGAFYYFRVLLLIPTGNAVGLAGAEQLLQTIARCLFLHSSRLGIMCGGHYLYEYKWEERPSGCFFPPRRRPCTFFSRGGGPTVLTTTDLGILAANPPKEAQELYEDSKLWWRPV